jgi:putative DNA primase/helicase
MKHDLDDIRNELKSRTEELFEYLLGAHNSRLSTGAERRWGTRGSFSVELTAAKRGLWFDHEAGEGGDAFDLIQREHRLSFKKALAWARNWLGDTDGHPPGFFRPKPAAHEAVPDETEAKRARARSLWDAGVPINGTPAQTYLRGRGIDPPEWPDRLRWSRTTKELLVRLDQSEGSFSALQRIRLNPDGSAIANSEGRKIKLSLGPVKGAAAKFGVGANGPLIIAEGPETALSLWFATGYETWAICGVIGQANLASVPIDRLIVACPDDDPRKAQALQQVRKSLRRWRGERRVVVVATPFDELMRDKSDFNDTLMKYGPLFISDRMERVLHGKPSVPKSPTTVEEARTALAIVMAQIFADALMEVDNG